MDQVEEIKERLSIYDLVSEYVELKKAGRNFKGACPFHSEKTPSFVVSPEKGLAYCFGCNQGGDIFAFYQLIEGVDFVEALSNLADKVGVKIEAKVSSAELKHQKSQKQDIKELHDIAANFYHAQLLETDAGQKVVGYLENRGVGMDLIKSFKLGYAPDGRVALVNEAVKANFSQEAFITSGLIGSSDTTGHNLYDRFWQRLMVPIKDAKGDIVGFGGRALAKDQVPKYLNSSDTPIYNKGQILFGFSDAKEVMRRENSAFIVEGYFDVIAFHKAGFKNAVATCGTALTEKQVGLLGRFVKEVVFAFDADSAGREALLRGAEIALRADLEIKVLYWKNGKDPADLVKEDIKLLQQIVAEKKLSLIDFIWQVEFADKKADELAEATFITGIMDKYLPLIAAINSAVKRDLLVRKFAQFLRTEPRFLYDELDRLKRPQHRSISSVGRPKLATDFEHTVTVEEFFWGYLMIDFSLLTELSDELKKWEAVFTIKEVYKQVVDFYNSGRNLDDFLLADLDLPIEVSERFNHINLYLETKQIDAWSKPQLLNELKLLLDRLVDRHKMQKMAQLKSAIANAESAGDKTRLQELLEEYNRFLYAS